MRAVIQRTSQAEVKINNRTIAKTGRGIVVLLGVGEKDTEQDALWLANKIANLRIFADATDKMNLSVKDIQGEILIVSQFTLYGDCRKGRRPSYSRAAAPEKANILYEFFIKIIKSYKIPVASGKFRAMMEVKLTNDGPVTLLLDSDKS